MKLAPIIVNETDRLLELYAYRILDSQPESEFDDIAQIAAIVCQAPIALVSLIDEDRQWFKAKVGLVADETSRDVSFCGHAIESDDIFIVQDADQDPRFRDNPLVTGEPFVKFYAGAPLKTPSGQRLGTLCVIDHKPRYLTNEQIQVLKKLSGQVIAQLELRKIRQDQSQS